MFIENAYKFLHDPWRYIVGMMIILFFWTFLGSIPLIIPMIFNAISDGGSINLGGTQGIMEATGLSSNMFTFLMLLSFAIGFIGIYIAHKALHKGSFKDLTTTRKKVDWKRIFFAFGLIALYIIISTVYGYYSNPEDFEVQFKPGLFLVLFLISIIFVPLQTSFEEYLFRGYLMQGLGVMVKNRWVPLLVTSLIFGGLHISNPEVFQFGPAIMLYYIGTGLFLGIITLMDEGMELALGFHAGNNLITILLVTADWSAFQSESILKDLTQPTDITGDLIFGLLVFYPLLLLLFAKKYKWTNWKDKLFGKVEQPNRILEGSDFL